MDNSGFMALSNALSGLGVQVQTNFNAMAQIFEAEQTFQVAMFKEVDKINDTLKQIVDKLGITPPSVDVPVVNEVVAKANPLKSKK